MRLARPALAGIAALAALAAGQSVALGANSVTVSGPAQVASGAAWPYTVSLDDEVGGLRVVLRHRDASSGACGEAPVADAAEYALADDRVDITVGARSYTGQAEFTGAAGPRLICAFAYHTDTGALLHRSSTLVDVLPPKGTLTMSAPAVVAAPRTGVAAFSFTVTGSLEPGAARYLTAVMRPDNGTPCGPNPVNVHLPMEPWLVSGSFSATKAVTTAERGRQLVCVWLGWPTGQKGPDGQDQPIDLHPTAIAQAVVDIQAPPPVALAPKPKRASAPRVLKTTVRGRTLVARYRVAHAGHLTVRLIGGGKNRVIARRTLRRAATITVRYTRPTTLRPGRYRLSAVVSSPGRRPSTAITSRVQLG